MKPHIYTAALTAALAIAHPSAAAELVRNGGFETPVDTSGASVVIYAGAEPIGFEWTVTEGSVDVHAADGPFGGEPDPVGAGQGALDLVGLGAKGGIAQAFATVIGARYVLSFDYANNPFGPSAAMDFGVRGASGELFKNSVTHTGSVLSAMNWTNYTFEFTATEAMSTLFFTNTAGITSGGIYLDNVSVVGPEAGAIPEPATWALMIGGFGLAGSALRRRRRVALTAV
jgi:hypothetical protein